MLSIRASEEADRFICDTSWYAIYTRHQHEKTVNRILTSKGFETFLPLYTAVHNWRDRTKLVSLPLFPCYAFLKGALERRLDILRTPGIHGLVSNAGQPAAIPAREIESIRRAVESGSNIEPHPLLKCGDRVRVRSGALEGIEGILLRKKNVYRLVLSVEMLGKAAAIEIDAFLLERMNAAPSSVGCLNYSTKPHPYSERACHPAFGSPVKLA